MHVRVATVQIQSGKMQEAIDIYDNSVAPAIKTQKGFQWAYLLTDASSGKLLSITVWESEADMLESGSDSGYIKEQMAKIGVMFAGPPELDHYELSSENSR